MTCLKFANGLVFVSNDDKARSPLGLAPAYLQEPLLMHMEYKVKLLDHNFVIGAQHELIPSVFRIDDFTSTGDVPYSGYASIWVRSGKNNTLNASTHAF